MCDYRAVNSLLPHVKKAFSKAKGVLTLVPLPKIDEIYARLKGSRIYSTFDMSSGYYHMAHSERARPKQFLHVANGNSRDAHLGWPRLQPSFRGY